MKNRFNLLSVLMLIVFCLNGLDAQNYLIDFRAVGLYTSLDSVKVENLSQSTSRVLQNEDVLNLVGPTSLDGMQSEDYACRISPNPMIGEAEVSFYARQSGVFQFSIIDLQGEEVYRMSDYCAIGIQKFNLSGLNKGVYLFRLMGDNYCNTQKVISINQAQSSTIMIKNGFEKPDDVALYKSVKEDKNGKSVVVMPYLNGNNMRYTGYKNQSDVIKNDVPVSSKTVTFVFLQGIPTVTTANVENIIDIRVMSGGDVVSDGNTPVTQRGVCWSTSEFPTIMDYKTIDGTDTGSFVSSVQGLIASTTYYLRAYATNSEGTAYGDQRIFTTMDTIFVPIITTDSIFNICKTSVSFSGTVISDGGSPITMRGICWTDSNSDSTFCSYYTIDSNETSNFISSLINLLPNTTYYANAYADNVAGRGCGNIFHFSTLSPCSGLAVVSDADGNIYDTIVVGTQCWMKENLKTTRFTDGSAILKVTSDSVWHYQDTSVAAYCWYNNDSIANSALYGALYNWKVVDSQNLCPIGWHVPTKDEWETMEMYLMSHRYNYDDSNYPDYLGKALASTTNWTYCGDYGTVGNTDYPQKRNVTGFTAMPGGRRNYLGAFQNINEDGFWWSSTLPYLDNHNVAYDQIICYYARSLFHFSDNIKTGNSVRCIRTIEN